MENLCSLRDISGSRRLVPRQVLLRSPGPGLPARRCYPQHALVPSGLSPTRKGPKPLPKVFISEGGSKPREQWPGGAEVSKPEQIRLLTPDSQVAKSRLFQEETPNWHKSLAGLKIKEARIEPKMSARNHGVLEETKGTFWQQAYWT